MIVALRGTSMYYEVRGEGVPLLWIHGFPLTSRLFAAQHSIPGVRHITADLRGFGESERPSSPITLDDYALDLLALLDHLAIARAVVAGVSMGGYIAMAMVRHAPERVAGLILIDTRETSDSEEAKQNRMRSAEEVRRDGSSRKVSDAMLPKMLTQSTAALEDDRVDLVREMMHANSAEGVAAALLAMAGRPDSSETLSRIAVPTLIVVGGEDSITPLADSKRMNEKVSGSELVVVDGAAHLSNVEKPEEFNRAVSRFLETHFQTSSEIS